MDNDNGRKDKEGGISFFTVVVALIMAAFFIWTSSNNAVTPDYSKYDNWYAKQMQQFEQERRK